MPEMNRLPAMPLVVNDPYFSIWSAYDHLTDGDTTHWSGAVKRLYGEMSCNGHTSRFLGLSDQTAMPQTGAEVTPTRSIFTFENEDAAFRLIFETPMLPEDMDLFSAPVTSVRLCRIHGNGPIHITFRVYDDICYDGGEHPAMLTDCYDLNDLHVAYTGRRRQNVLEHSGDHVTINWGYLYLASHEPVSYGDTWLQTDLMLTSDEEEKQLLLGYDDVVSINYFGYPAKAWYAREGASMPDMLTRIDADTTLHSRCEDFDRVIHAVSTRRGGEEYAFLTAAAYRHTIAAHKLIADRDGEMVLLSKENDSNGCIGTVDVSYPSTPLFLLLKPDLVRALCRGVLKFAAMPVWPFSFAPHDIGRYPYATGQVYGSKSERVGGISNGDVHPPYYLYPAGTDVYRLEDQMPVEECGNMLIMIASASYADGKYDFAEEYLDLLSQWVEYLIRFGEDPGDQLCTDDFAGHLSHNVNLAAKAIVGIASYARILTGLKQYDEASRYEDIAADLAKKWLMKSSNAEGSTALTFDGAGWSLKYNLVWDLVMKLNLLPKDFYQKETASYLNRSNEYGIPLDCRKTYTKSDWILWVASMATTEQFPAFIRPVVHMLKTTESRVPFSDWYDTVTGRYEQFIARSVQGGLFMPMLVQPK